MNSIIEAKICYIVSPNTNNTKKQGDIYMIVNIFAWELIW
jgi:hypothetical protein